MFATLFVLLYVGHLLADYPLQTDHQAGHKADRGAAGWRASLAHAGTHAVIDRRWPVTRWMRSARQAGWATRGGSAHVDQTAHITALFIAALALAA